MNLDRSDPVADESKRSAWIRLHFAALACIVLLSASGCAVTVTDSEYTNKLVTARTGCTGKEIVGVWVSKLNSWGTSAKSVLLVRPDGTGILRMNGGESMFNWTYAEAGQWRGIARDSSSAQVEDCNPSLHNETVIGLLAASGSSAFDGVFRFSFQSKRQNCALSRGFSGVSSTKFSLGFRYNGRELLLETHGDLGEMNLVFVRSDDQQAVEDHLKQREDHVF